MHKLTILYGPPADPAAFDDYYRDVHVPLAAKMPGFTRWTITSAEPAPDGTPPAFHTIVELFATDRASLESALETAEARAASDDVANFATGGAVYVWGDEREVPFT